MFIYFVFMINWLILYVVSKCCDIVGFEYLLVIILYFLMFFYFKSELLFIVDILLLK